MDAEAISDFITEVREDQNGQEAEVVDLEHLTVLSDAELMAMKLPKDPEKLTAVARELVVRLSASARREASLAKNLKNNIAERNSAVKAKKRIGNELAELRKQTNSLAANRKGNNEKPS